jgi:hypothetical protein
MYNYIVDNSQIIPRLAHIRDIGDVLGIIINILMGVGVSLSLIFIGLAGIKYLTAGGNPDNMEQAQKALTYSIVALVLSVGAIAVKYIFFGSILGINDPALTDPIPGPGVWNN